MTALKAYSLHTKNPRRTRLQSKKRLAVSRRQPELLNQAKCGKFVLFLFQPSAKTSAEVVCKIVAGGRNHIPEGQHRSENWIAFHVSSCEGFFGG